MSGLVVTVIALDQCADNGYQEVLRIVVPSCDQQPVVGRMVPALHVKPRPAPRHPKLRLGVRTGVLAKAAGAPFDPCTIIGWGAFPKSDAPGRRPVHPTRFDDSSLLKVGCSFHSEAATTLVGWGDAGEDEIREHDTFTEAKPVTIAGRKVLRASGKDGNGKPNCAEAVLTDHGFVGVSTSALGSGSRTEPCTLDRKLIEKLVPKLP